MEIEIEIKEILILPNREGFILFLFWFLFDLSYWKKNRKIRFSVSLSSFVCHEINGMPTIEIERSILVAF